MAQTKVIGGGGVGSLLQGVEQAVDPLFLAARIALRPLDYSDGRGTLLGHYGVAQTSGAIAATPTALDPHASIRWAPSLSNAYCVLLRLRVGYGVISAVATAVRMAYQASVARQFTTDFSGATTAINMATVAKSGAMRSSMGGSLMGANGPRICTTGPMTGQVYTLDNAPFALTSWEPLHSVSATGTAVQLNAGAGGPMQTLYECTSPYQHPPVLASNEGVVVQLTHTGWAGGTVNLYTEWTWAEVVVF